MATIDNEDAPTRRRKSRLAVASGCGESAALSHNGKETQSKKKKRRSRREELDAPFHVLFLQVGTTLLVICLVSFHLYRQFIPYTPTLLQEGEIETYDDNMIYTEGGDGEEEEAVPALPVAPTPAPTKPTPPPLPTWDLGNATKFDAFGIAELYEQALLQEKHSQVEDSKQEKAFWDAAENLRNQFAETYGGENAVRAMLERSMSTFQNNNIASSEKETPPTDLVTTACRIQRAKEEGRPFKFTFGGYSVTVGRGNYFSQSFPFVMQELLETPFQLLGIELIVENAAIGGCPSFPYGFCKKNHFGNSTDVVSWDFSMNEAGGVAEGMEAYLRHMMTLSHRPKLLVKDTYMADKRRDLLKQYVEMGAIHDPVVLHADPGVRPFIERPEEFRPIGFQEWRKFGSPPGAPGQALHHPAVKEHRLLGSILTMHFLSALELLAASESGIQGADAFQFTCPSAEETKENQSKRHLLPPPVLVDASFMQEWSSLFFGLPKDSKSIVASPDRGVNNNENWKMNPVHCRTTYDPIVDEAGSLTSIVVSGSTGENMDLMLPKGHMFYNQAWVLDLSEGEKDAKRKLDRFGGLGFVDTKKAYRGLFTSGVLRLLIPYYDADDNDEMKKDSAESRPQIGDPARDWFQNIVVCEVNERSEPAACQIGKDITFRTGGANSTDVTLLDTPGTLFLGKKICTVVRVPEEAKLTTREAMLLEDPEILDDDKRKKKAKRDVEAGKTTLGLSLELSVHNHRIIAREKACSVSHVVWEQRRPDDPRFPLLTQPPKDAPRESAPNNDEKKGKPDHHHGTPSLETGNVEGSENVRPLKDYVQGVKQ